MARSVILVLAAGRGVRMRSSVPKVLHLAAGRPLIDRVLDTAAELAGEGGTVTVVVGASREQVGPHVERLFPAARVIVQEPQNGTGDAVRVAEPAFGAAEDVVVLSGDVPLLRAETVRGLLAARRDSGAAAAFLTVKTETPGEYGRVVRDGDGRVTRVVEARDAAPEELKIREVNAGIYVFERAFLESALPLLTGENAQGELYLTDVLATAFRSGREAKGVCVADPAEVLGVNSRADLARVEAVLRSRAAEAAMAGGATLLSPATTTLDDTVELAPDVVLEPFVTLLGATSVGEGTRIGQGTVMRDATVGRGVTLKPYCVVESAVIGDGAIVGPFARLREGTELAEGVHIGNFVETKKARLARGVKANHLTYLGDTSVGERTNVGAGVITCNYDGFTKHRTEIGAGVFVGSDVQLVAPVAVGDGAVIGAGTTVTDDVPADSLAISRAPQKNIAGWAEKNRQRKRGKGPAGAGA